MSVTYKNYPVKIDGSSVLEEIWSVPFGTTDAAMNYESAVVAVLDQLTSRAGGVGQKVLSSLPKDKTVVIVPYDGNGGTCNAWADDATVFERGQARVCFSPVTWKVGGVCVATNNAGIGNNSDEILLHEFLHAYRKVRGSYNRAPFKIAPDKLYDDIEELWSILLTNIYMSEKGATKFRKDHAGFDALPAKWATSDSFMRDPDFFKYIELFWIRESALLSGIATGSLAAFNPLKSYKALIDAQESAQAASW
ncbi:MAG TPA: hypothetical protein VEV84_15000 [Pyrinomonadaceae bacterium]|nr:hypothetical protein [Pyrinomonadaceae bacterium]